MKVLHLGCGRVKSDQIVIEGEPDAEIISLDADATLKPDILCRLGRDIIPLPEDSIDAALAVHVLEHIGRQGETWEWFLAFEEIYRVLKPDGKLQFECPLYDSMWAWADPSHTRALSPVSFLYFSQDSYRQGGSISPFRIHCDFVATGFQMFPDPNPAIAQQEKFSHFRGELKAIKPLKPWWENAS